MNRMMRIVGLAVWLFTAVASGQARAQADGAADMAWPAAMAGALPPAEILAEVRREGFYPVGRPVQRGRVYVLYAVDQDDFDVKLTVDAASGQVLWVTAAVARFGGPGKYGYRPLWRERPPVPPAEVPAGPAARNNAGSVRNHASLKRFPPLPRTRPADLAGTASRNGTPADSAPPAPSPIQPAAAPITMAPVAPLE